MGKGNASGQGIAIVNSYLLDLLRDRTQVVIVGWMTDCGFCIFCSSKKRSSFNWERRWTDTWLTLIWFPLLLSEKTGRSGRVVTMPDYGVRRPTG